MSRNRLLIVDDEAAIAALVAKVAGGAGYEAVTCATAEEFRRLFHELKPTHLMLDLNLPGTDGIELLRFLAGEGSRAQVMLMSGVDPRVLETAARLGRERGLNLVATIPKPFRVADLRRVLAERRAPDDLIDEAALRQAIEGGQLTLDFQPKIRLSDRRVTECEALARWRHPTRGQVPPMEFVTIAERTGLANALTEEVARLALGQVAAWRSQGLSLDVAINLSGRNLVGVEFADMIVELCRRSGAQPDWVTLELTETAAAENALDAMDILSRLRLRGFRLSIDDFGTGYSSLRQLQRLPFSELKIDREFVQGCATRHDDAVIVKTVVDLAHNLGLSAVAEGAEDKAAVALLAEIGCDHVQGYYFSRPMPADKVEQWMRDWSPATAG